MQVTQAGNVLKIESAILRKLSKLNPELPVLFHTTLENYIRQISQKAVCNMYHSVEERFCTWLLMVHDRAGDQPLALTHERISRHLGTRRAGVTSAATALRDRGVIDYTRGHIRVTDREALEAAACECYPSVRESTNLAR